MKMRYEWVFSLVLFYGCGQSTDSGALPKATTAQISIIEDGRASISFPSGFSPVKTASRNLPSPQGEYKYTMYSAERGPDACSLGYADYPDATWKNGSEIVMDTIRDGRVRQGDTLEKETKWSLQGFPARTHRFASVRDGKTIYERHDMIIVKNRLYDITCIGIGQDGGRDSPEVQTFFNSIKILSK